MRTSGSTEQKKPNRSQKKLALGGEQLTIDQGFSWCVPTDTSSCAITGAFHFGGANIRVGL
jgi:hypothetical protein